MWQTARHIIESHERAVGHELTFEGMAALLRERLKHLDHDAKACRTFAKEVYVARHGIDPDGPLWQQWQRNLKHQLERAGRI